MTELALTLEQCETEIERAVGEAKECFAVIARNMGAIKANRLYEATHETFESYVSDRWSFSRQYAYRLIAAAGVLEDLSTGVSDDSPMPQTESQCREIAKLAETQKNRQEVWATAVTISTDGKPDSAVIRRAAEIVQAEPVVNVESAEIDAALREFGRLVEKLTTTGKRIQSAFDAKYAACTPMQSRRKKYTSRIEYLAERVELLREGIETLAKEWSGTKRQVDE